MQAFFSDNRYSRPYRYALASKDWLDDEVLSFFEKEKPDKPMLCPELVEMRGVEPLTS